MSITTNAEVIAYIQAGGVQIPSTMVPLINGFRARLERQVKDYVGYDVVQAEVTEYYPEGIGNPRLDGDATSMGFDLNAGYVVPRGIGRNFRREIVLSQLPVRSVASVYDNSAAWNVAGGDWPATALLPTNAYYFDQQRGGMSWNGIIYRNVGSWSTYPRSVKITYTAGLTADELTNDYPEFKEAIWIGCAMAVAKNIARGRLAVTGQMLTSVSIEDFSASFGQNTLATADGAGLMGVALPTECRQLLRDRMHPARRV